MHMHIWNGSFWEVRVETYSHRWSDSRGGPFHVYNGWLHFFYQGAKSEKKDENILGSFSLRSPVCMTILNIVSKFGFFDFELGSLEFLKFIQKTEESLGSKTVVLTNLQILLGNTVHAVKNVVLGLTVTKLVEDLKCSFWQTGCLFEVKIGIFGDWKLRAVSSASPAKSTTVLHFPVQYTWMRAAWRHLHYPRWSSAPMQISLSPETDIGSELVWVSIYRGPRAYNSWWWRQRLIHFCKIWFLTHIINYIVNSNICSSLLRFQGQLPSTQNTLQPWHQPWLWWGSGARARTFTRRPWTRIKPKIRGSLSLY